MPGGDERGPRSGPSHLGKRRQGTHIRWHDEPMIGRLHHVVIDTADPDGLAAFYSELLGLPVTHRDPDWVVVSADATTSGLAFQLAPDHQAPQWPDPQRPQQFHLDVMVDDIELAAVAAQALGARRLESPSEEWAVFADPAGHPFCLVPRPGWAPPIG